MIGRVTTSGVFTEYRLPRTGLPTSITTNPDGALWFTEPDAGMIGRITVDGTVAEFPAPDPGGYPYGITTGSDGNVWFNQAAANSIGVFPATTTEPVVGGVRPDRGLEAGGATVAITGINLSGATAVAFGSTPATTFTVDSDDRITVVAPPGTGTVDVTVTTPMGTSGPSTTARFTFTGYLEFPTPTAPSRPYDIASGPDGNVWFSELHAGKIGRVNAAGTVAEFSIPTPNSGPRGITGGPDGNVWFVETAQVGRITPDGAITEFPVPSANPSLSGITTGPDDNLWFTAPGVGLIGTITTAGTVTEHPLPGPIPQAPGDITAGPDGNLWFTSTTKETPLNVVSAGAIGRITTTGAATLFPLPNRFAARPTAITSGPDGNLWFKETGFEGTVSQKVARITPDGAITEFFMPSTVTGNLSSITTGSDGALWVTAGDAVVRVATDGTMGVFPVPLPGRLVHDITSGPDGNLWVTEPGNHAIGSFAPFEPVPSAPEVRQLRPGTGPTTGGTEIEIVGVNLLDATAVHFGAAPATSFTVIDAGHVVATSPPSATTGSVEVTVTTPRGATATTDASRFWYSADECGQILTKSTKLKSDIGPCWGDGVIVGADNITLDLKGHRVFGFPGPSAGHSAGIRLPERSGVTVRGGTVTDFDAGVFLDGGRDNVVRNMVVRDNIGPDDPFNAELGDGIVLFDSADNRITNNTVIHNGIFDGIGVLGVGSNGNVIRSNTIKDTVGPADGGGAGQGIAIDAFLEVEGGAMIRGNDVTGNTIQGNGAGGISLVDAMDARIQGNLIESNAFTNVGNGIGVRLGNKPQTRLTNLVIQGNVVRGNGEHGIWVTSQANRIVGNVSTDNSSNGPGFNDLFDSNPSCDANVWKDNTWGSAGYNEACTTTGGSGPATVVGAAVAEAGARAARGPTDDEVAVIRGRRRS